MAGRDGIIRDSTVGRPGVDVGATDSFRRAAQASDDHLIIGRPYRMQVNGAWIIALV